MRALITAVPGFGHLLPMLPLARAARHAGAEVLVATHESLNAAAGNLPLTGVGPEPWELMEENGRHYGSGGGDATDTAAVVGFFTDTRVRLTYRDVLAIARDFHPDLIVADEFDFVAPLVASRLGVPWVVHGVSRAVPAALRQAFAAGLAERFAELGLAPVTPAAQVAVWPQWLQPDDYTPPNGLLQMRPSPHTDETAPPFDVRFPGREDRPTVLFTLGTVVQDRDLLTDSLRQLAALDVNTIVTVPVTIDAATLDLPADRVRAVGFVPLDQLLAHASVLVGAGGAGTVLGALSHGLPLALVPVLADQPWLAAAAAETGAAIVADGPSQLGPAVQQLLSDPRHAQAARAVAERLAEADTPAEVWRQVVARTTPSSR